MHRAKKMKFEPSLAKTRAREANAVRKCLEQIEEAAKTMISGSDVPSLPPTCSERSVEIFLVARLGLKGLECLRTATRMVPTNFYGKRAGFVTAIFNTLTGQALSLEACENYLSVLSRCTTYCSTVDLEVGRQLAPLNEATQIGHAVFLSPPVDHCINGECDRHGSPLSVHHAPVNVTVFTATGPLPGCKLALKCSGCSVIYNYSKYGNRKGEGEQFYDVSRELVEVSDVVYTERHLSNLFTYLK